MSPQSIHRAANEVMANPKVAARIAEARQPAIEAAGLTIQQHLNDLKDLRDRAANKGQFAAAITAEVARGRVSGFYEGKQPEDDKASIANAIRKLADKLPGA